MTTESISEKATCRCCGKALIGKPYYMGGHAYIPKTMELVKVNFYGGFVCSKICDEQASLDLERTMPGHSPTKRNISMPAQQHFKITGLNHLTQ